MKETIVVLCAHNDDVVIGAGGTLAKYAEEGKDIVTIIFSYGEASHPWLQRKVAVETRVKESQEAGKVIGGSELIYLALREGKFADEIKEKNIAEKIEKIIREKKPVKIFTHSINDIHPDHRAVYNLVSEIADGAEYKGDVYSFDIWNIINTRKRDNPKLVVDITKTFHKKIEAFRCHKSQKVAMIFLMWSIHLKAIVNGLNNGVRFAEVFYKIK